MTFQKGYIPWNKNKKTSKETKEKISKALKGNTHMLGKHRSKETKEKIRQANYNKTYYKTAEFKEKMRVANKGKKFSLEHRKNISNGLKGRIIPEKTREKMSMGRSKADFKEIGLKGLIKQQNMKKPTSIEKKVYDELKNRGLLFEIQKLINGRFIVDAYIPKLNLIVEVDGAYWHLLDRVRKKDKAENAYLTKCGFNMLRLGEDEINNGEFKRKLPL